MQVFTKICVWNHPADIIAFQLQKLYATILGLWNMIEIIYGLFKVIYLKQSKNTVYHNNLTIYKNILLQILFFIIYSIHFFFCYSSQD